MPTRSLRSRLLDQLPDNYYIQALYFRQHRRFANLKNPSTFTEKIQWLKIYGNLQRFATYADKYTVREYIADTIGKDYLVPLLGVWDRYEQIPFDDLPHQFVLKVTHGCGYNIICKNKNDLDYAQLKKQISDWLKQDFYTQEREPQYRLCTPRIICEQYLEDDSGSLRDYKIWCAKGIPTIIQVDTDRFTDHRTTMFNTSWKELEQLATTDFRHEGARITKPGNLHEMIWVARQLSRKFPFVRVDLYSVNNRVYFGELTFTPGSGFVRFESTATDSLLGTLIDLDSYKNAE